MTGCCAPGCTNRDDKGFIMKKFPQDPLRRKLWADKVNREGWSPTNSSCLCEVHFEACMWEKPRVDGKRVLKWNAIPTLFPQCNRSKRTCKSKKPTKKPVNKKSKNIDSPDTNKSVDIPTASSVVPDIQEITSSPEQCETVDIPTASIVECNDKPCNPLEKETSVPEVSGSTDECTNVDVRTSLPVVIYINHCNTVHEEIKTPGKYGADDNLINISVSKETNEDKSPEICNSLGKYNGVDIHNGTEDCQPDLNNSIISKMTGCCAYGCIRRAEQSFIIKKCPRNKMRGKHWASKANRLSFRTYSSNLCNDHFEAMWKTREDGGGLLKWITVPTLYPKLRSKGKICKTQEPATGKNVDMSTNSSVVSGSECCNMGNQEIKAPDTSCSPDECKNIDMPAASAAMTDSEHPSTDEHGISGNDINEPTPVASDRKYSRNNLKRCIVIKESGCCAVGCTNSAQKGYIMYKFPHNPVRRKLWADKVNRQGWIPTNSSCLCEVHFHANMWRKSLKVGKRVLRYNALPTIFPHSNGKKIIKTRKTREISKVEEPGISGSPNVCGYIDIPTISSVGHDTEHSNTDNQEIRVSVISPSLEMCKNDDFQKASPIVSVTDHSYSEFGRYIMKKNGSTNTTEKSHTMIRCQENRVKRKQLVTKVNKEGCLSSSPSSSEVHLEADKWKKRNDGQKSEYKRKIVTILSLLYNALYNTPKVENKTRKCPERRSTEQSETSGSPDVSRNADGPTSSSVLPGSEYCSEDKKEIMTRKASCSADCCKNVEIPVASPALTDIRQCNLDEQEMKVSEISGSLDLSENADMPTTLPVVPDSVRSNTEKIKYMNEKLQMYRRVFNKMNKQNKLLKHNYMKLKKLVKEQNEDTSAIDLKKVFNVDQIKFLQGKSPFWSDDTIKNAIKLKFSCGDEGYKELLKQNYPLPSLRTLRRKIEELKKNSAFYQLVEFSEAETIQSPSE